MTNSHFNRTLYLALLAGLMITLPGCGGCSSGPTQADMMRAAMRNTNKDDDEDDEAKGGESVGSPTNVDSNDGANERTENQVARNEGNRETTIVSQPRDVSQNRSNDLSGNSESSIPNESISSSRPVATLDTNPPAEPSTEPDVAIQEPIQATQISFVPVATIEERRQRSIENMELIVAGIIAYTNEKKQLPWTATFDTEGRPLLSWRVNLLPYLGHQSLYEQFRMNESWDSEHNSSLLAMIPDLFRDPELGSELTPYLLPKGSSTAFPGGKRSVRTVRIEDGLENTLLLVEVNETEMVPWTKPEDMAATPTTVLDFLGDRYSDGFFAAWGDGSVARILPDTAATDVFALFTIDGGEGIAKSRISRKAEADFESTFAQQVASSNDLGSEGASNHDASLETVDRGDSLPSRRDYSADFAELAYASLQAGNEYRGFQEKYMSILLGSPREASRYYGWSNGLNRPVISLRWGVGIDAVLPPRLRSGPQPIRDEDRMGRWEAGLPGESSIDFYTGEVGMRVLSLLRSKQDAGDFGSFASVPALNDNQSRGQRSSGRGEEFDPEQHYQAIQLLGLGSRRVLRHVGDRYGVDVVAMFDLEIKPTRTNQVYTTTTLILFDVATGEELYKSPPLNNIRVERDREDRLKDDPVAEFMVEVQEAISKELGVTSLPTILPENARSRIEEMKREVPTNPLAYLAELHLYFGLGVISEYEYQDASLTLTEDDGAKVLVGNDPIAKRDFLQQYIHDGPDE